MARGIATGAAGHALGAACLVASEPEVFHLEKSVILTIKDWGFFKGPEKNGMRREFYEPSRISGIFLWDIY